MTHRSYSRPYKTNSRSYRSYKMQHIDDVDDVIDAEVVRQSPRHERHEELSGIWEDTLAAGRKLVGDTVSRNKDVAQSVASDAVEKALRSSEFNKLLVAVEGKAREGVVKEVKANLPTLIAFTVAGGALGGAIAQFGGKVGTMAVIGLALYMGSTTMSGKK